LPDFDLVDEVREDVVHFLELWEEFGLLVDFLEGELVHVDEEAVGVDVLGQGDAS